MNVPSASVRPDPTAPRTPRVGRLVPPRLRTETIPRPRLDRLLEAGRDRRLTIITAPAGYGKTTALAAWSAAGSGPRAWVTVDAADNDPVRFLAGVADALDDAVPGAAADAQRLLRGGSDPASTVVPSLATALAEGSADGAPVVVLDDVHLLSDPDALAVLAALVDTLPDGTRFVLGSRGAVPLALGRRRVTGELLEVGQDELRFAGTEIARYLNGSLDLDLDGPTLAAVERRTEGWPAAVSLVGLALQARPDAVGFVSAGPLGTSGPVAEYLTQEVLARVPDRTREFLVRTAVLHRMNPELCAALLQDPEAAQDYADARRSNLLIASVDDRGEWARPHALLRELLLSALRARGADGDPRYDTAALHRRAAEWFEEARLPEDAVEHAIEAGDGVMAARIVAGQWWSESVRLYRHRSVLRMIDRMPRERGPYANLVAAIGGLFTAMSGGREPDVQAHLKWIDPDDRSPQSGFAPILAAGVWVAYVFGDVGRAVRAGEALPHGAPESTGRGLLALAIARWYAGDVEGMRADLDRLPATLETMPVMAPWLWAARALLALEDGTPEVAVAHATRAEGFARLSGAESAPSSRIVFVALGSALVAAGQLDEAAEPLRHGLTLSAAPPGTVAHAHAHIALGTLHAARRETAEARRHAIAAREIVDGCADPGAIAARVEALEARIAARPTLDSAAGSAPTEAELRVLRHLPSDASLATIAGELFLSTNTVKSHVRRLYRRLGVGSRPEAVAEARRRGLL
jgi:LuxR family maltose regulon positive regulatory protein